MIKETLTPPQRRSCYEMFCSVSVGLGADPGPDRFNPGPAPAPGRPRRQHSVHRLGAGAPRGIPLGTAGRPYDVHHWFPLRAKRRPIGSIVPDGHSPGRHGNHRRRHGDGAIPEPVPYLYRGQLVCPIGGRTRGPVHHTGDRGRRVPRSGGVFGPSGLDRTYHRLL